MFKTIVVVVLSVLLSFGTASALDTTSAVVGYAVGKSGSGRTTVVNNGSVEMGVLPFKCTLSAGKCIYAGPGKANHISVKDVCKTFGSDYKYVGFKKVGQYDSSIIVLCKEIKTGCAKCH